MSHLQYIAPFEPQGKMKEAFEELEKKVEDLVSTIDQNCPDNEYSVTAKTMMEYVLHACISSMATYAMTPSSPKPRATAPPKPTT